MSNPITGTVSKISCKDWYDSKRGQNIQLYSFQLEGNNRWLRTGTTKPTFDRGESISCLVNEKGNVDMNSVQKATQAAPAAASAGAPPASSPRTGNGNKGGGTDWAAKDKYQKEVVEPRIGFQASRAQAVSLVSAALAADAISFGSTAKGKRLGMLLEYVDQVTDRFFLQAQHASEHLAELEADAASVLSSNEDRGEAGPDAGDGHNDY